MNGWAVVVAGGVVVGYGVLSRRLSTTVVSGPLVFVLCGLAIGPLGLDLLDPARDLEVTRALLEGALVLLLFADAAGIRAGDLRREEFLPLRLLAVGLPATMALGWLAAWPLLPGLSVWELALVAVVLAPTDAALGQQAVSNKRVPALVRGGLSVESGLNDGLALPFFVLALAAAGEGHGHPGIAETFLRALLLSAAIGIAAGRSGASLLRWSLSRGWSSSDWQQFLALAVPIIAYALCVSAEGSGFIGAWVAGVAFGIQLRRTPADGDTRAQGVEPEESTRFTERLGLLLASLSFLVFGAVILGPVLQHLTWRPVVYGLISLTVVRMLPVALALAGSGLRPASVAYIGWFGPRGLASLVFGLIAFEEHLPGGRLTSEVVAVTVGLSILLHGATAPYLGNRYGAWFARSLRDEPNLRENALAQDDTPR
ncbi:cation:proton antiporter [Streptomyces avidinii]|uniref:NhaP-type Na+/H+ or K+/H+ antiporter n=1 Tax=Streptomyces avidinii TaxID=1895 RepID=A0ABS4KW42_STRAV|nr:cation:proton antiporter [Streptomyces avidinii]MBP2034261.1 NhaP-type Na+/H+ or K+/H+ antiporter [Streptomyces avidinii]GGZ35356.1 sodium:proton antiporter [Streptomyces avidinii]